MLSLVIIEHPCDRISGSKNLTILLGGTTNVVVVSGSGRRHRPGTECFGCLDLKLSDSLIPGAFVYINLSKESRLIKTKN